MYKKAADTISNDSYAVYYQRYGKNNMIVMPQILLVLIVMPFATRDMIKLI